MRRAALRSAVWPAVTGLLAAAGQAPLGLWWLAVPGLSLLTLHVAKARTARARLWRGWCAGVGYFTGTLFWIVEPFMVEAAHDGWMAPFALAGMAGGMALFWMLAGGLAGLGRGRAGRAFGFAVGLAATDLLRSYALTGFPWALAGHIWIGTPVAQAAAWIGPIGLSVLTMALALAPVLGAEPWQRLTGGAAAFLALLVLWELGDLRLAAPDQTAHPVRVRLVQPNATQSLKWLPGMWDTFVDRQMQATSAPAAKPLDLVIWPETALPYLLEDAADLIAEAVSRSGGVPVVMGIQRAEGPLIFNSLIATDGTGAVRAVYDKHHLVPFGEYVPFGDLLADFGVTAFASSSGHAYTPGSGATVIDLGPAGKILPLICYEAAFPQDLRAAPIRADWILQVTNDGWFGNLSGPWQHLAQSRLRAIEQGLPLMRVANTGITAAIDPRGRIIDSLPMNSVGWLDVDVPAPLPATLYSRTGDWPATMVLIGGILTLGLRRRKRTD